MTGGSTFIHTVFFEIRAKLVYMNGLKGTGAAGYLQDSLAVPSFLKFNVNLPNRPGALFEFLHSTTRLAATSHFSISMTGANPGTSYGEPDHRGQHAGSRSPRGAEIKVSAGDPGV